MTSKTTNKFSPEVRARAVRMILDHASDHLSLKPNGLRQTRGGSEQTLDLATRNADLPD